MKGLRGALALVFVLSSFVGAASVPDADGVVVGRLVRGATRAPLAGTVTVRTDDGLTVSATAGADGVFRVEGLPRDAGLNLACASGSFTAAFGGLRLPVARDLDVGDVSLGAGAALTVVARDLADRPLAGADVTLTRIVPKAPVNTGYGGSTIAEDLDEMLRRVPAHAGRTTRTDAKGSANFDGTPPGKYVLTVNAAGRARVSQVLDLPEEALHPPVTVRLPKAAGLSGVVRDASGRPRPGVEVRLSFDWDYYDDPDEGPASLRTTRAGPGGEYSFPDLAPTVYRVAARAGPDREQGFDRIRVPIEGPLDLTLSGGATLTGTVVDDETGAPVAGAVVVGINSASFGRIRYSARTLTAADGSFVLTGLCPGRPAALRAGRNGWLAWPDNAANPDGAPAVPGRGGRVAIRLRRGAEVAGRVTDEDGRPVPFAEVWALTKSKGWGVITAGPTRSGADGRFRLRAVDTGRTLLGARVDGFAVRDFPECISDVFRGSFGRPPPPHPLVFAVPNRGVLERDVALAAAPAPAPSRAPAAGTAVISGRVVRADQAAPSEVEVTLSRWGPPGDIHLAAPRGGTFAPVAADGTFRIEGLPAMDQVYVGARAEGCRPGFSARISLGAGETKADVMIELSPELAIAGRVVDEAGRPVVGAIVWVEDQPLRSWFISSWSDSDPVQDFLQNPGVSATTDSAGRFRAGGLAAGEYHVSVAASGFALGQEKANAGTDDVRVVVPRLRSIAGRVVDRRTGKPAARIGVWCPFRPGIKMTTLAGETADDGSFEIFDRAPGTYTLSFGLSGFDGGGRCRPERIPDVAAGTRDLVVEVDLGLSVSGRVVDPEGAPASDVPFRLFPGEDEFEAEFKGVVHRGRTNADGSFVVSGLAEGTYTFTVGDETGETPPRARRTDIPAGTEDLVIRLRAGR